MRTVQSHFPICRMACLALCVSSYIYLRSFICFCDYSLWCSKYSENNWHYSTNFTSFVSGGITSSCPLLVGDHYLKILNKVGRPKALIYGAGRSGRELANALSNSDEIQVVGFLDDDVRLHGHILNGLPINRSSNLPTLLTRQNITNVLLAMPSVTRKRRNSILKKIRKAKVSVRTLLAFLLWLKGK